MLWIVLYTGVFAVALVWALVLTPLAGRWGARWGMLDAPGQRKIHHIITPRSGGLAIYGAFAGTLLAGAAAFALLVRADATGAALAPYRANLAVIAPRLIAILGGLTMAFIVGLVDDRKSLGPRVKLVGQILAAVPLLLTGVRIDIFLQEWVPAPLAWGLGAALTVAWVVLLMNSLNFLDNMDGLTGGVACVISLVLAGFSVLQGHIFMTAAYLALAGALLGFLRYNWAPARLFMGDSGSLTIGYALAALTINSRFYDAEARTGLPVLIPLIVLSVPLFDTASVMLIRWRRGAPLMQGDTNHLSHRLVALGFTRPQAVTFICLLTFVTAMMALPLRHLSWIPSLLHAGALAGLFALIFIMERVAQRKIRQK